MKAPMKTPGKTPMKSGATHTMKDGTVHTRAEMAAEKSKAPMAKGGMRHGGTVKGRK